MQLGNTTIPETLREGRYTVGKLLGQGGMAIVATAHDNELGVDRAVKVLFAHGHHRSTMRRRLKAEARAMARLQHPNILSIHDVGAEGDIDYVVMDLAVGGSLQDKLQAGGPFRAPIAIQYMIQVLSALAAAHAEGVVHRDVKPHNILLDGAGRALLADFGIALLTGDDRRTKSGVAMGSLAFMPPEQRLDAAKVGPAADVYAAGSTLFNLLTGENPVDLFLATDRSPRWQKIPPALKPVLMKSCTMDPEDRWATAGDMAYALLEVLRSDADGYSTVEGPLEPSFPAPSEGFSHHTKASQSHSNTLLPPETSSATAHAVAALQKIAPTTHHATRTSHESTPAEQPLEIEGSITWAPTMAPAQDAPIQRRRGYLLPVILLTIPVVLLLGWWLTQKPSISHKATAPTPVVHEPTPGPFITAPTRVIETPDPILAPTPTPASPTPALVATPPLPSSTVGGAWHGTMGGAFVDLQLRGPNGKLRGTMRTTIGSRVSKTDVRGTFDASASRLSLLERGVPAPARFELDLLRGKLEGSVIKATGGRGPLVLSRP